MPLRVDSWATRARRNRRRALGRAARRAFVLLVLPLLVFELAVRLTGLDERLVLQSLSYVGSHPGAFRVAEDPELRYETVTGRCVSFPSSTAAVAPPPACMGPLGARGREGPLAKGEGRFRVLVYGGSTIFGEGVADDETLPARLEEALIRRRPALRAEVWNFGRDAYVLSQAAYLARGHLATLAPDLVVVQLYNAGRRPFLWLSDDEARREYLEHFAREPSLWAEEYPGPVWMSEDTHGELMATVASYRALRALALLIWGQHRPGAAADERSCAQARALVVEAAARGVPVAFFAIPATGGDASPRCPLFRAAGGARFLSIWAPGREPAYYDPHPPAAILAEWAEQVAEFLSLQGMLPGEGG